MEGRSGGGLVTVTLSGSKGEMKRLSIDPSLFKEDDVKRPLEDLSSPRTTRCQVKAEEMMQSRCR